jgi:hypothetical protein
MENERDLQMNVTIPNYPYPYNVVFLLEICLGNSASQDLWRGVSIVSVEFTLGSMFAPPLFTGAVGCC